MKETTEQYLERVMKSMIDEEGYELFKATEKADIYYSSSEDMFAVHYKGVDIWSGTIEHLLNNLF
ncbi:hypothetical protein D307_gp026 [Bacillus phage Bastille]|uniref:Uncharacterized protein n=2 Tax=Bastillevirus TaxID=1918010 RepID=J9PL45_9CAUD|nr:hypothetical protein D307_gp026 [Bacillus phage Bastille]YP_009035232.1 hypothetical protein FP73_gp035 [Bacillus phage Hoody T]AEQ34438.1 hypothetical protein [Bacillus phage Bastille]AHZ10347.1 hypothetical protein [Bacillus phage Hoody T]AZF89139.1 hypothetical protein Goe5_c00310 [Bacillus phage vB_BthM-Goe5]